MPMRDRPSLAVETPERHIRRIVTKLIVLLLVLLAVQIAAAFIYHWLEPQYSLLDCLYNVVMLVTAIGANFDPKSTEGKWFNIFLALFSVAMLVGVMTQIGQLMLRREFLTVLSDWRHQKMKDHTIICGISHTSNELLNRLPVDKVVVLVKTHDEAHRIQHERPGIQVHVCDYTSSAALKHANAEHASLVIAASESDADNAFACLTAKHIRKDLKVITRMSRTENREKMEEVGSDAIISPAELAANAVMAKIAEFEKAV